MTITVLDSSPALDGLDFTPLERRGTLVVHRETTPDALAARLASSEIVVLNKVRIGAAALAAAPDLKLITVLATGYDVIDTDAARERGIVVCNVAGYSTASTAQHAIALLLELANQVGVHARSVAEGEWVRRGVWSYAQTPLVELDGKTLVVIGYGAIGSRAGAIARALGMRVLPVTRTPREGTFSLEAALPQADVVLLQCPLTPATRGLVDTAFLAKLRPGALLVNSARGPVVDEAAVAEALRQGHLAGFATDVLSTEPPAPDNPLLTAPNCLITPHLAWASRASRQRLLDETVENIRAFQEGRSRNRV